MTLWAKIICMLVVAMGGLVVMQLWYPLFTLAVFIKLMITLGVVTGVVGIIATVRREATLKDQDFID